MSSCSRVLARLAATGAALLALAAGPVAGPAGGLAWPSAAAETAAPAVAEKEAFAAAKELGTIEAWEAFLTNYPTGFHADLARAYVKKLATGAAVPATGVTPAPAAAAEPVAAPAPGASAAVGPAEEVACGAAAGLRSASSAAPAQLQFVNASGEAMTIVWLDYAGARKAFARLESGQQVVQETFLGHPWLALDSLGNCRHGFLPRPGTSLALLTPAVPESPAAADATDDEPAAPAKKAKAPSSAKKSTAEASAAKSCSELGLAYKNGQCVAKTKKDKARVKSQKKKGCPQGTYLNPLGVCQPNETGG